MPSTPGVPQSAIWSALRDTALAQDANYRMTPQDRAYIDSQILGLEYWMVSCLLAGTVATLVTADPSGSALNIGDVVILSKVTSGTVAKISTSYSTGRVFGVVVTAAVPGGAAIAAIGGLIPGPLVPELAGGASPYAIANLTTGRTQLASSLGASNFLVGTVDSFGNLNIDPVPLGFVSGNQSTASPPIFAYAASPGTGVGPTYQFPTGAVNEVQTDTTAGVLPVTFNAAPNDGDIATLKDIGKAMGSHGLTLTAGGAVVEFPPGTTTTGTASISGAQFNGFRQGWRWNATAGRQGWFCL